MNPVSGYLKAIAALVLVVIIGAAVVKIYDFGFSNAQTIGAKQLADYKASLNGAAASSVSAAFADYASGVARGQAAEAKFVTDQRAGDDRADALKKEIDDVAQPHVAAPPVVPQSSASVSTVYRCVFSRGFVRLWNAAAGVTDFPGDALQAGSDSTGVADGTGDDETADSGVSQRDIIDWLVDFANIKRTDENKLKSIRGLQPAASATTADMPASSAQ